VKPKTFTFIANAEAAERRTIVAHSASYGFDDQQFFQAPAGATENHGLMSRFSRPVRGLNYFAERSPTIDTVGYFLSLLRSYYLWRTPSLIC